MIIYKTEEEFIDNCPCASSILKFVAGIKNTDVIWFFDVCYVNYIDNRYSVIFKSYITEEFKDYLLSVEVIQENKKCNIRIIKKVDNLLNDNA